MPRLLKLSNPSLTTQKKIRQYANVKRNTQLIRLTEGRATNVDDALKYFAERYNNEILQRRKENHRNSQANYVKRKKAIEKLKTVNLLGKIRDRIQAKKNLVFVVDYKSNNALLYQVRKSTQSIKRSNDQTTNQKQALVFYTCKKKFPTERNFLPQNEL